MKSIYSNFLRMAITAGLTQREQFVDRVSQIIAEKTEADPEYGAKIAESIVGMTEAFRDELMLKQIIRDTITPETTENTAANEELGAKIERLTQSIDQLTELLKEQKK